MPWAKPASSFIAFADGFHGRTMGALALTWKARHGTLYTP
jgi:acetylornithine/succinyldiaminopimelate/putrescine aminotransferase